jgi:hypothetical protein
MVAAITAAVLLASGGLAAGASAATQVMDRVARPAATGYSISGDLEAVAATSATNAWAVGISGTVTNRALILHWNGHEWSKESTGVPTGQDVNGSELTAVAASSASNAWAIGSFSEVTAPHSVIVHWNGHAWKQVSFPEPADDRVLSVSVTSATNAWVVGEDGAAPYKPWALRWNGKAWKSVPMPKLPLTKTVGAGLTGVSATSASNAWAVGVFNDLYAGAGSGFALHWNGKSWSRVASTPAGQGSPVGVAATAANDAWLIGCACQGGPDGAVLGLWNGRTWKTVTTPVAKRGTFGAAGGAIAASGHLAWASGAYCAARCNTENASYQAFLLRWTGSAWKQTALPDKSAGILGLAVTSAANAWAVGNLPSSDGFTKTAILHWNGSKWS